MTNALPAEYAEKIGVYSAINGTMEIGLGSFLHSMRVPFRSYILPAVQDFCLIHFSKQLRGRGLVSISAITSGLKSFSPAGARLSPMIFIFSQGLLFSLPIYFMGHNFFSVLTGSMLLQLTTMTLGLGYKYMLYGWPILETYLSVVNTVIGGFSIRPLNFSELLFMLFTMRVTLGASVAIIASVFDLGWIMEKWQKNIESLEGKDICEVRRFTWAESLGHSARDICRTRFLFPFIVTALFIFFFSSLNRADFASVMLRAVLISWFSLVLSRRIDFQSLSGFLEKNGHGTMAAALRRAMGIIIAFQHSRKKQ